MCTILTTLKNKAQPCSHQLALTSLPMETLQERIKAAMAAGAKSQTALAKACGISDAAVSKWIAGDTVELRAPHVFAVARACKVDAEWLATGHGAMRPKTPRIDEHHLSLLQDYRMLDQETQTAVRTIIVSLARLKDPAYLAWQKRMEEHNRRRDAKAAQPKT